MLSFGAMTRRSLAWTLCALSLLGWQREAQAKSFVFCWVSVTGTQDVYFSAVVETDLPVGSKAGNDAMYGGFGRAFEAQFVTDPAAKRELICVGPSRDREYARSRQAAFSTVMAKDPPGTVVHMTGWHGAWKPSAVR